MKRSAELEQKYQLTEETLELKGKTLYRIKALRDFKDVKKGNIGGWVEKEYNLSHGGNCWISENAKVYENARISESAKVSGNAQVFGHSKIYGYAEIYGNSQVYEESHIFGKTKIYGDAKVYGETSLYLSVEISTGEWSNLSQKNLQFLEFIGKPVPEGLIFPN